MLNTEALPEATEAPANTDQTVIEGEVKIVPEGEAKPEAAPAKTEAELRIEQLERQNKSMQRGIDRRTRQLTEARAQRDLTRDTIGDTNRAPADDSAPISLTRAELEKFVKAEAQKLAPTLSRQALEDEQHSKSVQSLMKSLGTEKFHEATDELAEMFDAPKQLAVLGADDPQALLLYLTDPENADETEAIGRLGAVDAGRRLAKIEAKIALKKVDSKEKASKAPAPIEDIKSTGNVMKDPSKMTNKEFADWRRAQIKARH